MRVGLGLAAALAVLFMGFTDGALGGAPSSSAPAKAPSAEVSGRSAANSKRDEQIRKLQREYVRQLTEINRGELVRLAEELSEAATKGDTSQVLGLLPTIREAAEELALVQRGDVKMPVAGGDAPAPAGQAQTAAGAKPTPAPAVTSVSDAAAPTTAPVAARPATPPAAAPTSAPAAARAASPAAPTTAPVAARPAKPGNAAPAGGGASAVQSPTLTLVRCAITAAEADAICRGEVLVRNDGPGIAPAKGDLFNVEVAIHDSADKAIFRQRVARGGNAPMKAHEQIALPWSTKHNEAAAADKNGVYPLLNLKPGRYTAHVTLSEVASGKMLGKTAVPFTVVGSFAKLPSRPTLPAPVSMQITGTWVEPPQAGQPLNGRFTIRNTGPAFQRISSAAAGSWSLVIQDNHGQELFREQGNGSPAMKDGEQATFAWSTKSKDKAFTLPGPGHYNVIIELRGAGAAKLDVKTLPLQVPPSGAAAVAAGPTTTPAAAAGTNKPPKASPFSPVTSVNEAANP